MLGDITQNTAFFHILGLDPFKEGKAKGQS